jgi:hypothetical protein
MTPLLLMLDYLQEERLLLAELPTQQLQLQLQPKLQLITTTTLLVVLLEYMEILAVPLQERLHMPFIPPQILQTGS